MALQGLSFFLSLLLFSLVRSDVWDVSRLSTFFCMQETQQPLLDKSVSYTPRPAFIMMIIILTLVTRQQRNGTFIMITGRHISHLKWKGLISEDLSELPHVRRDIAADN